MGKRISGAVIGAMIAFLILAVTPFSDHATLATQLAETGEPMLQIVTIGLGWIIIGVFAIIGALVAGTKD